MKYLFLNLIFIIIISCKKSSEVIIKEEIPKNFLYQFNNLNFSKIKIDTDKKLSFTIKIESANQKIEVFENCTHENMEEDFYLIMGYKNEKINLYQFSLVGNSRSFNRFLTLDLNDKKLKTYPVLVQGSLTKEYILGDFYDHSELKYIIKLYVKEFKL